jgi:hypothetical protein
MISSIYSTSCFRCSSVCSSLITSVLLTVCFIGSYVLLTVCFIVSFPFAKEFHDYLLWATSVLRLLIAFSHIFFRLDATTGLLSIPSWILLISAGDVVGVVENLGGLFIKTVESD